MGLILPWGYVRKKYYKLENSTDVYVAQKILQN